MKTYLDLFLLSAVLPVLTRLFSQIQAICYSQALTGLVLGFLTNRRSEGPRLIRLGPGINSYSLLNNVIFSQLNYAHNSCLSCPSWPNLNTIAKRFLNFVPLCLCPFASLQPYNSNNSSLSRQEWFKETAKKRKTTLTGQKSMIPKKQEKSKQSQS
jgi:hypothetical protein